MTDINKIAAAVTNQVMANLTKIAVDGSELVPGMPQASAGSPKDQSGTLIQAIEEHRGPAGASPVPQGEDMVTDESADLIKKQQPNDTGMAEPLQKQSSVTYTGEEAQVLHKLASVGYETLVDKISDQIVNEKIAEAVAIEQANAAPQKIARALLAQQETQKTAAAQNQLHQLSGALVQEYMNRGYDVGNATKLASATLTNYIAANQQPTVKTAKQIARDKLASVAQQDPQVLQALRVLNAKGLL